MVFLCLNDLIMLYKYLAVTRDGKFEKGEMDASSQRVVSERLRESDLLIISIKKRKERQIGPHNFLAQFRGVSFVDRVMITRYLSVMIKAGVNIAEAINILREQTASLQLKKILAKITDSVREGRRLSDSFALYPKIFPDLYVNIIRAGEESGTLEENLNRLADQLERDYDLRRNVLSAMFYPVLVIIVTFVLGVGLALFVLPKVTQLFESFNVALPISTRILLWFAKIVQNYGIMAVVVMAGSLAILTWFFRRKIFRPYFHRMILMIPILGHIVQNVNLARFCRIFSSLLKSGLAVNEALKILAETLGNIPYRKSLQRTLREVEKGNKISDSLKMDAKLFPPVVFRTISVGEQSGNLEEILVYLAEFYEEEVQTTTKNLSTVIEPLLLVGIGLIVGGIAMSIITPIYKITGAIAQ